MMSVYFFVMRVTIQNNYHMALNHLIVIYVNLTKLFSLQEKSKKFQASLKICKKKLNKSFL